MYIDGNEVGRQAAVLPNLRDSDFSIGGVYHRNQPQLFGGCDYGFKGSISGVRISNTLRYDGAFVPSYTLAADGNTVGKWELGLIDNGAMQDLTGNHAAASLDRGPAEIVDVPPAVCE